MKRNLTAAALILLLGSFVFGQATSNRRLVFTGSVFSVKTDYVYGAGEKEKYRYAVELYLQFKNDTDSPLIIFKPADFYGETRISFLEPYGSTASSEDSQITIPWENKSSYDPFPFFVRGLEGVEPDKNTFAVIAPGGYYECRQTVRLKSGYKLELKPNEKIADASPIPDFRAFRLEYYLSMKDRPEDYNPLATAKRRWKKIGQLLLNSDGDYLVTSEIILNKLRN